MNFEDKPYGAFSDEEQDQVYESEIVAPPISEAKAKIANNPGTLKAKIAEKNGSTVPKKGAYENGVGQGFSGESDEENNNALLMTKLNRAEFDEIAQRHEQSLKLLELVKDAQASKENFANLKGRLERECDQMTIRVQVVKLIETKISVSMPGVLSHVFKIHLTDLN
jgi:hypothetical protein